MIYLPKFVLCEVEDSILNGILGVDRCVSDIVLSTPYLGAKEFNRLFKNNGTGKRPTRKKAIFKDKDYHRSDTMSKKFGFCKVLRYGCLEGYSYGLIHVPDCNFEKLEIFSKEDMRVEYVKYQYDIRCKNYITTHFVFESIFKYGYFKLFNDDLRFEYDIKDDSGESFSILKSMKIYFNNERVFDEFRVMVEEISEKEDGFEPNIVRISIWTDRVLSGGIASTRFFYDDLMTDKKFMKLDRFLKFKKIKSKYFEKVADGSVSLQEQVVRLRARLNKEGVRNGTVRECLVNTGRDLDFLGSKLLI